MAAQYTGLAGIYDQLMAGVDYSDWADYILKLIGQHGGVPGKKALDLACGTGSTTLALAERGYSVTGLDLALDMLAIAGRKAAEASLPVMFLQADIRDFLLAEKVDLAVAFQDGLNYLLSKEDFSRALASVSRVLNPQGLFIFDINRVEKLPQAGGDVACVDSEEFTLIWETSFIESGIWEIAVTGFVPAADGLYTRFREVHRERVIPVHEVREAVTQAGLTLLGEYAAFSLDEPTADTRRVFYVAGKGR